MVYSGINTYSRRSWTLEISKKDIGILIAIVVLAISVYAIGKGFIHAFETLPERIGIFVTQFGK